MFDDRDAGAEQDRVGGAGAVLVVVDVQRIDAHQHRAAPGEILGSVFREEGMLAARVCLRTPVLVPAGVHEDGLPFYVAAREACGIDRTLRSDIRAHDNTGQIGDCFQRVPRDVAAVFVAMERGIDVGPGVRKQLDLPDLESRARRVPCFRRVAREPIADRRRGETAVGHHAVLDFVTQIDETLSH